MKLCVLAKIELRKPDDRKPNAEFRQEIVMESFTYIHIQHIFKCDQMLRFSIASCLSKETIPSPSRNKRYIRFLLIRFY